MAVGLSTGSGSGFHTPSIACGILISVIHVIRFRGFGTFRVRDVSAQDASFQTDKKTHDDSPQDVSSQYYF